MQNTLRALRSDLARIHRYTNCADDECACRSGRPMRDAAGFLKQHLWADPIIAFGRRHFAGRGRSFCHFLASPIYYPSIATRIGYRVSCFFYNLRPSVRAESRRLDEQGVGCYSYGYPSGGMPE